MTQVPKNHRRQADITSHRPASRRRSSLISLGVAVVAVVVVLGLVTVVRAIATNGSSGGSVPATANGSVSSGSGSISAGGAATSGAAPSTMAPTFTLATLSGTTFSLASARGHPVVLYFMATTCGTCVQGSRDLAQAVQSAHVTGAHAVAIDVNAGDSRADLASFVQATGVPTSAPVIWGVDTQDRIAQAYGVQILETTVVLDAQGRIAYENPGPVAPQQLAQIIQKAG